MGERHRKVGIQETELGQAIPERPDQFQKRRMNGENDERVLVMQMAIAKDAMLVGTVERNHW